MTTIQTIATAIEEVTPFHARYIREELAGERAEFLDELTCLARGQQTPVAVREAIAVYCAARSETSTHWYEYGRIAKTARESLMAVA
ncbi:hypothetical protein [Citricoccus nitrophenolicus]|uniref:hypothetical protein n=1 Tax=Citricoccus nitrophenolicus TaxID=863575 RepID=UPI0031EFDC79